MHVQMLLFIKATNGGEGVFGEPLWSVFYLKVLDASGNKTYCRAPVNDVNIIFSIARFAGHMCKRKNAGRGTLRKHHSTPG